MAKMALVILCAFILDCIIGDPQNPIHPIRIIGNFINFWIKKYKASKSQSNLINFILGIVLAIVTVGFSFASVKMIVVIFYNYNDVLGFVAEVIFCYFIIAPKSLKDESMKVYSNIVSGDIEKARKSLSYIVGRDTENLTSSQIIIATVETIAENFSDGIIAPIIFVFIGGVPLGMAYKAVNTLDSMVGYRNDEFEYFGKFSAIFDDVVNFIPSRISAMCVIIATLFSKYNTKNSIKIFMRDRKNHKSPNSAQTESVFAGALGLQMGGENFYKGVLVKKPTIGEMLYVPEPTHIIEANRLMYISTLISVVIILIIGKII